MPIEWGNVQSDQVSALPGADSNEMLKLAAARGSASPGVGGMMAGMAAGGLNAAATSAAETRKTEAEQAAKLSEKEIDHQYKLKELAAADALKRLHIKGGTSKGGGGSGGGGSKGGVKAGKKSESEQKGYQVRVNDTLMDWDEFLKHMTDSAVQRGINEESKILERAQREWQKLGGSQDAMGATTSPLENANRQDDGGGLGIMRAAGEVFSGEAVGRVSDAMSRGTQTPFGGLGAPPPPAAVPAGTVPDNVWNRSR